MHWGERHGVPLLDEELSNGVTYWGAAVWGQFSSGMPPLRGYPCPSSWSNFHAHIGSTKWTPWVGEKEHVKLGRNWSVCEARKIIQGERVRCKLDTSKILILNTHLKIRTKRWHMFTVEFYEPQRETKLYHQKGSGWSWSSSYKQNKTEACFSLICTVHLKNMSLRPGNVVQQVEAYAIQTWWLGLTLGT